MKIANALVSRQRIYLLLIFIIPALGSGLRAFPKSFPAFFTFFAPDILWALLVFAVAAAVAPRVPTAKIAGAALGFCLLMECSQLYQAPWINDLRATRIGGLLLGFGFLWSDLVCYGAGIALGVVFDRLLQSLLVRRLCDRPEPIDRFLG